MSENGRKASDVLLEMEANLKSVLDLVRNLDLNNKIISNKLNTLIQTVHKNETQYQIEKPKFSVEAVDKNVSVVAPIIKSSPIETDPTGFRRTSRPETYAGDDSFLSKKETVKIPEEPVFIMKPPQQVVEEMKISEPIKAPLNHSENKLPVTQRVVDKNGKAVFLADVEIFNSETNELILKLRTSGVGKWSASLLPETYTVVISKREAVNKEKLVSKQTVLVDGFVSPLELQPVILK